MFNNKNNHHMATPSESGLTESQKGDYYMNDSNKGTVLQTHKIMTDQEQLQAPTVLEGSVKTEGFPMKDYNIHDMIERDFYHETFQWSSTAPIGSTLLLLPCPVSLFQNKFISSKIDNFNYIKCDIEITIKVNPTPFQQGALLLYLDQNSSDLATLKGYSYAPHSLLNVSVMNTATLRIPFLSYYEAYRATSSEFNVKSVVISPLSGASLPETLPVQVTARLLNTKLLMPAAQAGEEEEIAKTGIVTKITGTMLSALDKAGSTLQTIPYLGSIVPPLTWLTRITNGVASYNGWCKPTNIASVKFMTPVYGARMGNTEGEDNSVTLGCSPDNMIDPSKGALNQIDEMDFGYIFERKFIGQIIRWDITSAPTSVELTGMNKETTRSLSEKLIESFNYTRYMVKYEFHLVKTRFHTGRILVQFDPNNHKNNAELLDNININFSKIIDIATTDRFTFTVPYYSNVPFKEVPIEPHVKLYPFTPLEAPDTVTQHIEIIVYRSYADVQLNNLLSGGPWAQGPDEMTDCCGNNSIIPQDPLIPYKPAEFYTSCIGEKVTNLRSIFKRFCFEENANTPHILSRVYNHPAAEWADVYFSNMGSVRYKIIAPTGYMLTVEFLDPFARKFETTAFPAVQVFNTNLNNVCEISVPFYHDARRRNDLSHLEVIITTRSIDTLDLTTGTPLIIYTSMGDDCNFDMLLSADIEETTQRGLSYSKV